MKRNSYRRFRMTSAFLAFIFLFLLTLPSYLLAGMAVSPIQQWIDVEPGKQTSFCVAVTNVNRGPQTQPCNVKVELVDFFVSRDGNLQFGSEYKHQRSLINWIDLPNEAIVLEPGQSRQIKANISAPPNAEGDYWATVMVSLVNDSRKAEAVNVNLRTASGIFVRVGGRNYIARGKVTDAQVKLPQFDGRLKAAGSVLQSAQHSDESKLFVVTADLENNGKVAMVADGKAMIYTDSWRRVASVAMYTSRRRIFPEHVRRFNGVMSQPLPPGNYKLRVFFNPESKYSRTITRDISFTVSDKLAGIWSSDFVRDSELLQIEPQQVELNLTAGRFTSSQLHIASGSLSTFNVRCRLESDSALKDWFRLKSDSFTLAHNVRRNLICMITVPDDAEAGEYEGIVFLHAQPSGLRTQKNKDAVVYQVPVKVSVNNLNKYVAR